MADFQQNTTTNRQALLDYIDTNSGGGGGSQNLSDVLINGNSSGANDIVFDASQGLLFDNSSRLKEGTIVDVNSNKGIAQICGAGYELKWASGVLYSMNNTGSIIYVSTFNVNQPTINDDDTLGYQVGSFWVMNDGTMYICADTTTGAAVWAVHSPLNLELVLKAGASTGGNSISSPDANTTLEVYDGSLGLLCTDSVNTQNNISIQQAQIEYVSTDLANNDNTYILQNTSNITLENTSAGGNQVNQVSISQTKVGLENNLNGTQIQEIYVDGDTCNMAYNDGINNIEIELGLTNGFRAYTNWGNGDYENFIQVKFDKIHLHYKDPIVNRQIIIDTDGIYFDGVDAYDDNAAAVAAGLTAGYVFQTTGSGAITTPGVVCIVQ